LCLFIQNAEVAPSVAKIDPNRHSPTGFSFSKINQRSNINVLQHSPLSCSCTNYVHVRQLTASKLTALLLSPDKYDLWLDPDVNDFGDS
jgi:hypothetical protein